MENLTFSYVIYFLISLSTFLVWIKFVLLNEYAGISKGLSISTSPILLLIVAPFLKRILSKLKSK